MVQRAASKNSCGGSSGKSRNIYTPPESKPASAALADWKGPSEQATLSPAQDLSIVGHEISRNSSRHFTSMYVPRLDLCIYIEVRGMDFSHAPATELPFRIRTFLTFSCRNMLGAGLGTSMTMIRTIAPLQP